MRIKAGFFILSLILLVSGCNSEEKSTDINMNKDSIPPYTKTSDDIIDKHGNLENKERFDKFFNNLQQGIDDSIRVVRYTTEGDPIIYSYEFENEEINVTIDTRRDEYGQGNVIYEICTSLKVNEDNERIDYKLEGCSPSIGDHIILTIE